MIVEFIGILYFLYLIGINSMVNIHIVKLKDLMYFTEAFKVMRTLWRNPNEGLKKKIKFENGSVRGHLEVKA